MASYQICPTQTSGEQNDNGARPTPFLLRIPGELRNKIYKHLLEDVLDENGRRYFGGLFRRKYGYYNGTGTFFDPDRSEALHRTVSLLQVCRVLRQEFRPLFLRAPLHITIDLAAKYLSAFYPLSTPFPAETVFPPCRILLKQSPESGPVYITALLKRLYDCPQLEFAFEEPWPLEGLTREMNFLFADRNRALLWKSALRSTIKEIIYSEDHGLVEPERGDPERIYRIQGDLYVLVEAYDMRLSHLIEPSRSSVPIPLHKYLADLGLVRQRRGPISLSSSRKSGLSRNGDLRRELGFGLTKPS